LPGFFFQIKVYSSNLQIMNFSIIIPLYNEEKNIDNLIKEIFLSLNKYENNFEIILVNDASTDSTLNIIEFLKKKYSPRIYLINNIKNIGQSFSIIKGVNMSNFETIVTIDGDGQNNPKDISLLLKKYNSSHEITLVGGIRKNRKDNFFKKLSSRLANKVRKFILNDDCIDTGCSLKVFKKSIFIKFPKFKGLHRFLPALFKGYGGKTIFLEVHHRERKYGNSNYGTVGRLINGIADIVRVFLIIKQINND